MEIYQVTKGETLSEIALKVLGDASLFPKIMQLNNLRDTRIYPGQQLLMPDPDVLGPVVVARRAEPDPAPAVAPLPYSAGIGFDMDQDTVIYLGLGALLLFLALGKK